MATDQQITNLLSTYNITQLTPGVLDELRKIYTYGKNIPQIQPLLQRDQIFVNLHYQNNIHELTFYAFFISTMVRTKTFKCTLDAFDLYEFISKNKFLADLYASLLKVNENRFWFRTDYTRGINFLDYLDVQMIEPYEDYMDYIGGDVPLWYKKQLAQQIENNLPLYVSYIQKKITTEDELNQFFASSSLYPTQPNKRSRYY